jgi:hypothetical protein
MATEGGAAYRNSLVRRQEHKNNLTKIRNRQAADPMRWVQLLNAGKEKEAYTSYTRSAKKAGLSEDSYGNLIDKAYAMGEGVYKGEEFLPGLTGMINPVAGKRKINLRQGRSLEGLMGRDVKPVIARAGADRRALTGFGGALTDTMEQYGTTNILPTTEDKAKERRDLLEFIKESFVKDPRSTANMTALGVVAPFANLGAEITGNNNLYDFILATSSDTDRGDVIASKSMFKDYGTKEDLGWAATSLTPGSIVKGAKALTSVSKLAGKGAMAYPKTAGALGALAGLGAYTQIDPEEAEALNLSRLAELGGLSSQAGLKYINQGWKNSGNRAARKIIKQFSDEQPSSGLGRNEFLKEKGLYQTAGEANPVDLLTTYTKANPTMTDNIVEFAHDTSKAKGGAHTRDNVYLVPKRTNAAMKELTFKEFVEDQMKITGKSADEVAKEWGILHTPYK